MNIKVLKAVLTALKTSGIKIDRPDAKGDEEQTLSFETDLASVGKFKRALKEAAEEAEAAYDAKDMLIQVEDEGTLTDMVFDWEEGTVTISQGESEEEAEEEEEVDEDEATKEELKALVKQVASLLGKVKKIVNAM